MAIYRAIANGNWNNLAIWQDNSSGSFVASTVLPGVNDNVYSNNFVISLNVDINVLELSSIAVSGFSITGGGRFEITTNRTVTCGLRIFGSSVSNLSTITISGSNCVVVLNANLQSTGIVNSAFVCSVTGTGHNITINGNITGASSAATSNALVVTSTNTVFTINGNISGGITNTQVLNNLNSVNNLFNIYGNITNINASTSAINSSGGSLNVINIYGTVFANVPTAATINTNTPTILTATGTILNIYGTVSTANNNNAIAGAECNVTGVISVVNSSFPIKSVPLYIVPSVSTFIRVSQNAVTSNDYSLLSSIPAPSNVRSGINYTNGNTGTLIVPSPSNVRRGVPTDNTVGTADLTAADMWDYLASNITTSGSIGEVVKNTKTNTDRIPNNPTSNESVGAIVASYNV